jgi:hypothetical protein
LLAATLHFPSKTKGQRWSLELIYLPRVETRTCLPAKAEFLKNLPLGRFVADHLSSRQKSRFISKVFLN